MYYYAIHVGTQQRKLTGWLWFGCYGGKTMGHSKGLISSETILEVVYFILGRWANRYALFSCPASCGKSSEMRFEEIPGLMNDYAVETRYPGDGMEPDRTGAVEALHVAEQVVAIIRTQVS